MTNIKIILGSTRPGRFGIQPAEWIYELSKKNKSAHFELIDLEKENLPLLDEPVPPLMQKYSKDHTKAWSKKIKEADGFIFVTAEYNHSVPAALKNALDYLFHEWNYKPAAFVSYGSQAGGARAVEHLRGIAGEVKMYDLREHILLPNYWNDLNENGQYQFNESLEKSAQELISSVIFWSEKMKKARTELAKK